jgi:hypothetical protein
MVDMIANVIMELVLYVGFWCSRFYKKKLWFIVL